MFNKFFSVIVPSLAIFGFSCIGFAKEFKGTSEYYVVDLTTKEIALSFARDKAKQNALEQAGTYVTSLSESTNGLLTKDDIKVVTLGVAKLKPNSEHINYTAPDQSGTVTLSYSAVFDIDDKEVEKNIKKFQIDNKELKEEKIKNENQQSFIKHLGELYKEQQKKLINKKSKDKTDYNKAISQIREGLNAVEYREIADSYAKKLDAENALIYYKKELEAYNRAGINVPEEYNNICKICTMKHISFCYSELHQIEKAEAILEEALKLAKDDSLKAGLLSDLAMVQIKKGEKLDIVINLINKALSICPDDQIYSDRMALYFFYGYSQKALEDYERLSKERQQLPHVALLAAICYAYNGNYEKALQLDELISNKNKMFESEWGLAYTNYVFNWSFVRGKAYLMRYEKTESKEDVDKAIQEFTAFINLAPANEPYVVEAYFHRGVCYGIKNDIKSAYNDAMMALTIDPDNEQAKSLIKMIEEEQKEKQQ